MRKTNGSARPSGPNDGKSLRARIEELWLRAVRCYTFHTPIAKGRHRAYLLALKLCRELPARLPVSTRDGRRISVNLTTGMQTTVFFLGEYEAVVTGVVRSLLRPDDVCLDVGANFGWYTTLFHQNCGPGGEVHAFEPVPASFAELERNVELLGRPSNVFINNMALGDRPHETTIHLFPGEPTGHASLSPLGHGESAAFVCRVETLDRYLGEHGVRPVDFVKVDIEGAEMMFLQGAEKLFRQAEPPIFLMEMALQQTRNFGYLPADLINLIKSRADYQFYRIDEAAGLLIEIETFAPDDAGANVLCLPRGAYRDRAEGLKRAGWIK